MKGHELAEKLLNYYYDHDVYMSSDDEGNQIYEMDSGALYEDDEVKPKSVVLYPGMKVGLVDHYIGEEEEFSHMSWQEED